MKHPGAHLLALVVGLTILGGLGSTRAAWAYAWMIRHDYTACGQCHADPSGGSLLTRYGRAQGEILLRSQYHRGEEEPGKVADFLFGAIPVPATALVGGDVRAFYMSVRPAGAPSVSRTTLMQADLQGQVAVDRFRVNASLGYAQDGARPAAITHYQTDNLVSRTHWVGVDLGADRQFLLRAGRMNLPFGIRTVEHNLWARKSTRTDINDLQQHGVSLSYTGERMRGEFMAIAGNFQLTPTVMRQRGYSAYVELTPTVWATAGASSVVTHTAYDPNLMTPVWRQAHGLFTRVAPFRSVVLMAEGDVVFRSQPPRTNVLGYVGFAQADVEPWQGIHLMGTGEVRNENPDADVASIGGWASLVWFFAPHVDLRVDVARQTFGEQKIQNRVTTVLGQLHVFL